MIWLLTLLLAVLAAVGAAWAFRLDRNLWTTLGAALAFGLAGYALQASPDLPSAPKSAERRGIEETFDIVEARREFVAEQEQSPQPFLLTADAMARRGNYVQASEFLSNLAAQHPQDFEIWLALGNTLVEHADGQLTAPALYAYRQASALRPDHPAPGYFIGVSLIRQGRIEEGRAAWRETLENAPDDAEGLTGLRQRLESLDALIAQAQTVPEPSSSEID